MFGILILVRSAYTVPNEVISVIAGLVRRHFKAAISLVTLMALALVLTGFSGSPQTPTDTFSGPTNVVASAADGTITVTWTLGNAAASQVIVVVNVLDDTDYCLEVDFTGTANSYQCAGRTEGETYVVLVIALDGAGGYALGQTTQRVPVTFTGPERYPDLVVSTPTVGGDDPTIGATFTLQTTVTNRGRESSGATTLRYYRSTEPVISSADTAVGSQPVSGLAAAGTSDYSSDLTAPSEPGTYYYRVCVDRAPRESNTTNNCSSVLAVSVVAPDLGGEHTHRGRRQSAARDDVHDGGDGYEPGQRGVRCHHAALLQLHRRHDHRLRHGVGHRRGGQCSCC